MNDDKNTKRMLMYQDILDKAVEKRKENISAKELAEKLEIEPTSIYRLERGVNDMKLSTFLAYLDAFNYQVELVQKESSLEPETTVDFTAADGTVIDIQYGMTNPSYKDRLCRLRMLRYLIGLEEIYLESHKESD